MNSMKVPKSVEKLLETIKPLNDNLYMVALFGSYARGDYGKDSDIDLLVVSKTRPEKIREKLIDLVDGAMEATGYNELLSPIIMDVEHYEQIKKTNTDLFYFINKEGKVLWQTT